MGAALTEQERTRRFREIALPHLDAAYNLARWLTRNDHDAEDVVQESCLRAFRSFDSFRGDNGRPWLLAIVRNACYDWLRQNRAGNGNVAYDDEVHGGEEGAATMQAGMGDGDPAALLARADDRRLVNAALARLPVEYREVVVLRDIEDLSYKEIAGVMAIPMGTVMSRLARGRKLMLTYLGESMQDGRDGM
jgi:RNA polymerase sigma-70 factor (ECF subfamily)